MWSHSDILMPLTVVNCVLSLDDTSVEPDFRIRQIFSWASQICTLATNDRVPLQFQSAAQKPSIAPTAFLVQRCGLLDIFPTYCMSQILRPIKEKEDKWSKKLNSCRRSNTFYSRTGIKVYEDSQKPSLSSESHYLYVAHVTSYSEI